MRILLVEDEPGVVLTLTDLLVDEGHEVESATCGLSGLSLAKQKAFDLIILDVMLPGKSGLDVCSELRQIGNDTAILMLTAKTQVVDRVVGLKLGADDYLSKPFDPAELLARVEALLRRVAKRKPGSRSSSLLRYRFGEVEIDFQSMLVLKDGAPVSLASKELSLLQYLIEYRGQTVPREILLKTVWDYQADVNSRTIDVHIAWLRQKLEDYPQNPRYIQTVRGVGYRFMP
ncbi:response regulator transcription factor [Bryobacter aggregatus]|uniref:response regulator transcription factor n=1 Tax=Bryobacter aggregatus TaxID=360054 RepID=UPI0004E217F5|nr:response regulator transcription factor [Bryobacter aggregatus]